MTTIEINRNIATLINVFTVEPKQQQELVNMLTETSEYVMHKLPGFISANVHKSLDGTKVVNYAQWASRADFEAMLSNPDAMKCMQQASQLAKSVEPHLYEVAFVDEAPSHPIVSHSTPDAGLDFLSG